MSNSSLQMDTEVEASPIESAVKPTLIEGAVEQTLMEGAALPAPMEVKTFGAFSIIHNGTEISFGQQNESQIVHLMQLLLHFREKGVNRDLMKAELFGDRSVDDVSHSIRNIVYNLRKKLREYDLPDSQFVVKKNGIYYWADDIPVREDASEFESLINSAMLNPDDRVRYELLDKAAHLYTGRFLEGNESSVWTAAEADRYKDMFSKCINEMADILRQEHNFRKMYDLSLYAIEVDPFSEWEILTLESLSGLGSFDQTEKFYRETVDKYSKQYSGKSNSYVKAFINRLGMKLVIGHESLDEIQEKMRDKSRHENRGYFCSLPVFQEIYHITERLLERSGDRVFLMLCTILDSKGNPMLSGAKLEDLSMRLKNAIISSVRYTDTVTRYGKGQYLIMLIDTSLEDCEIISSRIDSHFIKPGQTTSVRYTVNNMIDFPDQGVKKEMRGTQKSKDINAAK